MAERGLFWEDGEMRRGGSPAKAGGEAAAERGAARRLERIALEAELAALEKARGEVAARAEAVGALASGRVPSVAQRVARAELEGVERRIGRRKLRLAVISGDPPTEGGAQG